MIHKYYGIKDKTEVKRGVVISTLFALIIAGRRLSHRLAVTPVFH